MTKREITNKYKNEIKLNRKEFESTKNGGLKYHKKCHEIYENYIKDCKKNGYTEMWGAINWGNNVVKG